MTAILSTTPDDLYMFSLPFAVYSWNKVGVECFVITTPITDRRMTDRCKLVATTLLEMNCNMNMIFCPDHKAATYAQCARLYAAASPLIKPAEVLITADADMCVFDEDHWQSFDYNGWINIIGIDLVPPEQVPMCYIGMPRAGWDAVMEINGRSLQKCVDDLLGPIEAEHFRGNYWGKDQEEAYKAITKIGLPVKKHVRASPGTQFATRRADRDGWPINIPLDIIDAHLPRPGYTEDNFGKIYQLFHTMYPNDDLRWMLAYQQEYVKLIAENV